MEGGKAITEQRRVCSLSIEKKERRKKKGKTVLKKEEKKIILETVPASVPECYQPEWNIPEHRRIKYLHKHSTEHYWYLYTDEENLQRMWQLKERRVLMKDAFRSAVKDSGKLCARKSGRRTKNDYDYLNIDHYEDHEEEAIDDNYEEFGCNTSNLSNLRDLSEFLVDNSQNKKRRKHNLNCSKEEKIHPEKNTIYMDMEENYSRTQNMWPSTLSFGLQDNHLLVDNHDLHFSCPVGWQKAKGETLPPRFLLEYDGYQNHVILMVGEVSVLDGISICEIHIISEDSWSSSSEILCSFPKDKVYNLEEICNRVKQRHLNTIKIQVKGMSLTLLSKLEKRDQEQRADHKQTQHPWQYVENNIIDQADPVGNSPMCGICFNSSNMFSLSNCSHSFCNSCWKEYVFTKIPCHDRILCPAVGCTGPVDIVTSAWLLLRPSMLLSGCSVGSWNAFLTNLTARLAPSFCLGCSDILLKDGRARCNCGMMICQECGETEHWPASCDDWDKAKALSNTKLESVEVEYRPCPNCGECWEKTYGCNHMTCARCKASFCWGCGKTHAGSYCGHLVVPIEIQILFLNETLGLSFDRMQAITTGLIKLKLYKAPLPGIQPQEVVYKIFAKCEPKLNFLQPRSSSRKLESLPMFSRLEELVKMGNIILDQGKRLATFGYFTLQKETMVTQHLLSRVNIAVTRLEHCLTDLWFSKSAQEWSARLSRHIAAVEGKMDEFIMFINKS